MYKMILSEYNTLGKNFLPRKQLSNNYKNNETVLLTFLLDLAHQALIKLALEPQWKAMLLMNHKECYIEKDVFETIDHIVSGVSRGFTTVIELDCATSLKHINQDSIIADLGCSKIISQSIRYWLALGLIDEYVYQVKSFDLYVFDDPKGCILAPLITNIFLCNLDDDLLAQHKNLNNSWLNTRLKYIRYKCYIFVLLSNSNSVANVISFFRSWFNIYNICLRDHAYNIQATQQGIICLNYHIMTSDHELINLGIKVDINPSIQALTLFVQTNREIIYLLRLGSINKLLRHLKLKLSLWIIVYGRYNSYSIAMQLERICASQIRAVILRKHPKKSKNWINKKYLSK
nr:hypothetical protein [Erythrocladia irregularis]